jgi:hypothetical protein
MTTIVNSLEGRCHDSRPNAPSLRLIPRRAGPWRHCTYLTLWLYAPLNAALLEEDHGYHQSWLGKAPVLDLTGFRNAESDLECMLDEWGERRYFLDTHKL